MACLPLSEAQLLLQTPLGIKPEALQAPEMQQCAHTSESSMQPRGMCRGSLDELVAGAAGGLLAQRDQLCLRVAGQCEGTTIHERGGDFRDRARSARADHPVAHQRHCGRVPAHVRTCAHMLQISSDA